MMKKKLLTFCFIFISLLAFPQEEIELKAVFFDGTLVEEQVFKKMGENNFEKFIKIEYFYNSINRDSLPINMFYNLQDSISLDKRFKILSFDGVLSEEGKWQEATAFWEPDKTQLKKPYQDLCWQWNNNSSIWEIKSKHEYLYPSNLQEENILYLCDESTKEWNPFEKKSIQYYKKGIRNGISSYKYDKEQKQFILFKKDDFKTEYYKRYKQDGTVKWAIKRVYDDNADTFTSYQQM